MVLYNIKIDNKINTKILNFRVTSLLFSIAAAPICIPINTKWEKIFVNHYLSGINIQKYKKLTTHTHVITQPTKNNKEA